MGADDPLLQFMLSNFLAAKADYESMHKSKHWDVFPADFENEISNQPAWPDFRNNGLSRGYDIGMSAKTAGPILLMDEQNISYLTRRHESLCELAGERFVKGLIEADIGNPHHAIIDGLKLNKIDQSHIAMAWQIQRFARDPKVIVDIGGGFGGVLLKLKRLYPNAKLVSFDLPEVNAAQAYYLGTALGSARLFGYTDLTERGGWAAFLTGPYDAAILPGWAIASIPNYEADLVINSRSMMEMTTDAIGWYFRNIHGMLKPGGIFYCANRYSKDTVGEDIRIKDYPFDDRWHFVRSAPLWQQGQIHEIIAERTAHDGVLRSSALLNTLPPKPMTVAALPEWIAAQAKRVKRRVMAQ